ncbi:MAG: phosphotransferase [Alphaproteobacteria bacterium]|nr:phosphotransferase [Alphaproteobacteria bacterium]
MIFSKLPFSKRHKRSPTPVEDAIFASDPTPPPPTVGNAQITGLARLLERKYGMTNIHLIVAHAYNGFLTATTSDGRDVFIKTGNHAGLYENEFKMGRALYEIAPRHVMKPLYYNDYADYQFFISEFVRAPSLETMMTKGAPTPAMRCAAMRDLYQIFLALQESDVVHRDIRPANFLWVDGRLVLIDFQLAVSKHNYQELQWLCESPQRLRKLGGPGYKYRTFVWDDNYSLLRVLEFIGHAPEYSAEYDRIHRAIKSAIGRNPIRAAVRESRTHRLARHLNLV